VLALRGDVAYHRDAPTWLLARPAGTPVVAVGPEGDAVAAIAPAAAFRSWLATAGSGGPVADPVPSLVGVTAVPMPPGLVQPARTPAEIRRLERSLLDALRKPTDGLISRHVNRRVSLLVTRFLMNTPVHPNHVTLATLVLGVASGLVGMRGGYFAAVAAALLLEAQSILDGVDGEMARLKHLRSRAGEWLDTIADDVSNLAFVTGIACNLVRGGAAWAIIVGTVTVGTAIVGRLLVYWLLSSVYRVGDQFAIRWEFIPTEGAGGVAWLGSRLMWLLRAMIKRDFFATLFVVLAILGRTDVILGLALIGAVGFLLKVVPHVRRAWRSRPALAHGFRSPHHAV